MRRVALFLFAVTSIFSPRLQGRVSNQRAFSFFAVREGVETFPKMSTTATLPAVNARVDIWFDGYDEFYPGRVDRINAPHEFHVVLDDGTDWDIDLRKHIFKLAKPKGAAANGGDGEEAEANDDGAVRASEAGDPVEEEPSANHGVRRSARAAAAASEKKEVGDRRVTRASQNAVADPMAAKAITADEDDMLAPPVPQSRRRASGRALRKSATPSKPREMPLGAVGPQEGGEKDMVGKDKEDETMKEDEEENEKEDKEDKEDYEPEAEEKDDYAPRRSLRVEAGGRVSTRSKRKEDGGIPTELPPTPPTATPPRGGRGRRGGRARKRSLGEEEDVAAAKRRRVEEYEEVEKAIKEVEKAGEKVVRAEDGVMGLSTKAVTAIAVDAALESAKAVLKPLNDRLALLVKELADIGRVAKKAAEHFAERPKERVSLTSAGTSAVLEAFQLDLAEIIGGGDERIKAYSRLSEKEIEGLHRMIKTQENALKELDRLLLAAQEFAKKMEENRKETENGTKNDK